ncbi:MAG: hypothetical protein M1829_004919 [Trizodia sp. TS-e1964]|nr:MAG: hypothetical protein M1829_004919 [Trizodia sp. TS-e1964]
MSIHRDRKRQRLVKSLQLNEPGIIQISSEETSPLLRTSTSSDYLPAYGSTQVTCNSSATLQEGAWLHASNSPESLAATGVAHIPWPPKPRPGDSRDAEMQAKPDVPAADISQFLTGVSKRTFWLIFGGVLLTYFVACFDSTLMASSHPVITSYFGSSNSASWLSTSFLLTSSAFQPLFGRLSDTLGRKTPYLFSMLVMMLGTVWCALAQSIISFIFARALCGLGAGGLISLGSIICSDLVPIETRGAYQSYLNLAYGLGSASGVAMGGYLADQLGWRWEFGVQVPAILLCLIAAALTLPPDLGKLATNKSVWESLKTFDFAGSFFLTSCVTFLILGLNLGGNILPWSHPVVISSLVLFLITSVLLVKIESKAKFPLMPLHLLLSAPRSEIIFSNFFGAIATNAILFNAPLYFQAVLLESPTKSGFRLILPSLTATLSAFSSGFYITWSGRLKPTLVLGGILLLFGAALLLVIFPGLPDWIYFWFLIPSSLGNGFIFPSSSMAILVCSTQEDMAVVTSTMALWRCLGVVLGIAISSLLVQNSLIIFLERMVTGPLKSEVVSQALKSVETISKMQPHYRNQVIEAYAISLKVAFLFVVVASLIVATLLTRVKLPRISDRTSKMSTAVEEEDTF